MIKIILFDCDGLIIRHEKYFSQRLAETRGLSIEDENKEQKTFFNGIFLECEAGKADLKEELSKNLELWNWNESVEKLMDFWFSGEANVVTEMKEFVLALRSKGIKTYLSTNNEKYRTEYLWNNAGLKDVFDDCLSSCYIGHLKMESEFWQKVYSKFGAIDKSEILVWDDDQRNILTAKEFGLNAEFYTDFESFKKVMNEKYQLE